MRSLKIAGVERYGDLEKDTLNIKYALTYLIDTCSFNVKGEQPFEEEEVIIEDSERRFAGIIKRVVQSKAIGIDLIVWNVECDDFTALLDKKLVVEKYENKSGSEIFKDVVQKYCPDFTTAGVQVGAPVVEYMTFDYMRPSECFKMLCEYIGWHWQPDYHKDLSFFNAEKLALSAPMELTTGGQFSLKKHTIDTRNLRNRIYIRGGKTLSDFYTYEIKADGKAKAWVLPHKAHDLSFIIGDLPPIVPGIENVTDPKTAAYLQNYQEQRVTASDTTPVIPDGTTLKFVYRYDVDVITIVDDAESQAAVAAVQGGDGVYEHVITDDSFVSIEAAEAAGYADLRNHGNPSVKGLFTTEVEGWRPGQIVKINLPDRGISGEYLIQSVTATPVAADLWSYSVEYGGRLIGIADFLQTLVSTQQKRQVNDTTIIYKFVYGAEELKISDEWTFNLRNLPWQCEKGFECSVVLQVQEGATFASAPIEMIGSGIRVTPYNALKWLPCDYSESVDGVTWSVWRAVDFTKGFSVAGKFIKLKAETPEKYWVKNYKRTGETESIVGEVIVWM